MKWAFLPLLLVAVPATARELPTSARPTQASLSPASESPEVKLARANQAYLNSDFRGTIVVARDLLYPEVQLVREAEERVRASMKPIVVAKHNRWLCLIPFGVGQFQNGDTGRGVAFLTTQFALGTTSLALWATLQLTYANTGRLVPNASH